MGLTRGSGWWVFLRRRLGRRRRASSVGGEGSPEMRLGGVCGQKEGKDGAMAWLAGEGDSAAVGFGDGAADGKAHACSWGRAGMRFATVEAFKDERLLGGIDADAPIGHADGDAAVFGFGGDGDGGTSAGVFASVFEEV